MGSELSLVLLYDWEYFSLFSGRECDFSGRISVGFGESLFGN